MTGRVNLSDDLAQAQRRYGDSKAQISKAFVVMECEQARRLLRTQRANWRAVLWIAINFDSSRDSSRSLRPRER